MALTVELATVGYMVVKNGVQPAIGVLGLEVLPVLSGEPPGKYRGTAPQPESTFCFRGEWVVHHNRQGFSE